MTVVFVGHEFGAVTSNDSNTYEHTDAGRFDSALGRCALGGFGISTVATTAVHASLAEGYVHLTSFHQYAEPVFWGGYMQLLTSAGVSAISIEYITNNVRITYRNGPTSGASAAAGITVAALNTLDVYFKVNTSSGEIRLYSNGSLLLSTGTIDLSAVPNIARSLYVGGSSGSVNWVSELVVSSEPTIGWRVGTLYLTGAGTTNTFDSGTWIDADEIVHSDADFLSSGTAGQIVTGAANDLAPGDYLIKGLAVTCRAKRGASGPQNIQLAIRAGSTNYFSPSKVLDVGYGAFVYIWETNPDTGIAWTESDIAAVEIGVKSIA